MSDIIEGEFEDRGSSLAVRQESAPAQWTPSFALSVDQAVERVGQKQEFFRRVMRQGDHYGAIPGTGTKPTLLKPGAELLLANMGLNAEFSDEGTPILDVTGADHNGEAFIWYRRRCRIYRQVGPTENERMLVGQASGSCNSWEKKYRYRNAERVCPDCGKPAIIKGKKEYGGGWVCFKRKDGCGAKFEDNDSRMQGDTGKIPNPEVFDLENTILKMADKRALVAATLIATGCSDIFTQDMEDDNPPPPDDPPPPAKDELTRARETVMAFCSKWKISDDTRHSITQSLFAQESTKGLDVQQLRQLFEALREHVKEQRSNA